MKKIVPILMISSLLPLGFGDVSKASANEMPSEVFIQNEDLLFDTHLEDLWLNEIRPLLQVNLQNVTSFTNTFQIYAGPLSQAIEKDDETSFLWGIGFLKDNFNRYEVEIDHLTELLTENEADIPHGVIDEWKIIKTKFLSFNEEINHLDWEIDPPFLLAMIANIEHNAKILNEYAKNLQLEYELIIEDPDE